MAASISGISSQQIFLIEILIFGPNRTDRIEGQNLQFQYFLKPRIDERALRAADTPLSTFYNPIRMLTQYLSCFFNIAHSQHPRTTTLQIVFTYE